MTKREQDRQGIQSIEVGARLLSALAAAPQAQTLSMLASAAGMPASKAHRYLVSFARSGLVVQEAPSGRYDVGPLAIALGLAALGRFDIVRHCADAIDAIRDDIDETVGLFVWATKGPTIVRLAESSHPVAMAVRVGSTLPLIGTATGRIFAAFLPAQLTQDHLSEELSAAHAMPRPQVPRCKDELHKLLDTVQRRQMARVAGEFLPGVAALGVPVFGQDNRLKAVITAIGRTETLDVASNGRVARALKACAVRLSTQDKRRTKP